MRAKEFVIEGAFDDLRKLGQQANADYANQLKQKISGALTPDWYKKLGATVAAKTSQMNAQKLSQAWQAAWAKQVEQINAANPSNPLNDDEYRNRFITWLEKTSKVRVDPSSVAKYITNQNLNSVGNYFATHFIPAYMKLQSDVQGSIPDGFSLSANTATQVGNTPAQVNKETYKWNARTDQWIDSKNKPVDGTSELYKQLTQAALSGTITSGQTLKGRYGQTSNAQTV